MRPKLDAGQVLQKARMELLLDSPFWGFLAMQLEPKPDPGCATLWTDGVSMGYNPQWVESTSFHEVIGVIAKLVMHICAGHTWRQSGRSYQRWNQACSFAVNPYLTSVGFVLPKDCEIREEFENLYAEAIYAKLEEEPPEPPSEDESPQDSEATAQPGQAGRPSDDSSSGEGSPEEANAAENEGEADGQGEAPCEPLPSGEVRQCDASEVEELRDKWKSTMDQASTTWGEAPLGLARSAQEGLVSETPWQEILRQVVEQGRTKSDYDWARPSAEYLYRGLYVPDLVEQGVEFMVASRDTSGSISDRVIGLFNAEISGLFQEIRPERATVLDVDCSIKQVQELGDGFDISLDDFSKRAIGGGGTSFVPAFDWISRQDRACKCLVYLTDLYGEFPAQAPDYEVIWVVPKVSSKEPPSPPFGTVVYIPAQQAFG